MSDTDDGASLGGAVQLRQDDAGTSDSLSKMPGLHDGVLAVRGIQNQKNFMRCAGNGFADHAVNFFEFFHQVSLRVQSACRVDNDNVDVSRLAGSAGIECDRGGIRAGLALTMSAPTRSAHMLS